MVLSDIKNNRLRNTFLGNSKKDIKGSTNGTLSDLFKNSYSKGIEFLKNIIISSYDQRKLSFGTKLKTGFFTPMNMITIARVIIDCKRQGRTLKETSIEVTIELIKIFSGMFFCHITTSIMEKLVDKILTFGVGKIIAKILLYFTFPPAPALLFIIDILISWLGGKVVDLIIWLYNRYLKQYVERAFDWIKDKVRRAWNWFTGLFN